MIILTTASLTLMNEAVALMTVIETETETVKGVSAVNVSGEVSGADCVIEEDVAADASFNQFKVSLAGQSS